MRNKIWKVVKLEENIREKCKIYAGTWQCLPTGTICQIYRPLIVQIEHRSTYEKPTKKNTKYRSWFTAFPFSSQSILTGMVFVPIWYHLVNNSTNPNWYNTERNLTFACSIWPAFFSNNREKRRQVIEMELKFKVVKFDLVKSMKAIIPHGTAIRIIF